MRNCDWYHFCVNFTERCCCADSCGNMFVLLLCMNFVRVVFCSQCSVSPNVNVQWLVDCSSLNLTTALPDPPPVGPVIVLNLSTNGFSTLCDFMFKNWTSVLDLDLSSNKISIIESETFHGLSKLNNLNLMNNSLTYLVSNITKHIPRLKILNLSSNKIKAIAPGTFQPVPDLQRLYLQNNFDLGNKLDQYETLKITLSQGLRMLNLSNSGFLNIPDDFFYEMIHLRTLSLAGNPLTDVPVIPHTLIYLDLSNTLISEIVEGDFGHNPGLQTLILSNLHNLKQLPEGAFNGLTKLRVLSVEHCSHLTTVSANVFGSSEPQLQNVTFASCSLATLSELLKPAFEKTRYVNLQSNPWECDRSIAWFADLNIIEALTEDLKCAAPERVQGISVMKYFKSQTNVRSWSSLIKAVFFIIAMGIFIVSIIAMMKHVSRGTVETYFQLQNIADRNQAQEQLRRSARSILVL